jgi:arylsulfatase A
MGNWKGVRVGARSRPIELFDLSNDPGEKNDVAGHNHEIVAKIAQLMKTARTDSKEFPALDAKA